MNQNDHCQCGGVKMVLITGNDGFVISLPPGSSQYLPRDSVDRIECACSMCGLLYSLHSLMSPVELYQ